MTQAVFGSSFGTGYGVTTGWVASLAAQTGVSFTNGCVNGGMFSEQTDAIYSIQAKPENTLILAFGPNEQRYWGADPITLRYWMEGMLGLIVYAATPQKTLGKNGVKTGSWSDTGVYGIGTNSFDLGDTAEWDAYGDVLYFGSIKQDVGLGTFQIFIDNEFRGDFSCAGGAGIRTLNYGTVGDPLYHNVLGTLGPMGLRFTCAQRKWHSIRMRCTSPVAASAYRAYGDWVAGNEQESGRVIICDIPWMADAGAYSSHGGSASNLLAYNTVLRRLVQTLRSDGLNVDLARWNACVGSWLADKIHPDQAAQAGMLSAVSSCLT